MSMTADRSVELDAGVEQDREVGPLPVAGDRGAGVPLTRYERRRLDFTRTTVVHARWCKAAASVFDVDDWFAHYDHRLTVGEHVTLYARASASPTHGPTLREMSLTAIGAHDTRYERS